MIKIYNLAGSKFLLHEGDLFQKVNPEEAELSIGGGQVKEKNSHPAKAPKKRPINPNDTVGMRDLIRQEINDGVSVKEIVAKYGCTQTYVYSQKTQMKQIKDRKGSKTEEAETPEEEGEDAAPEEGQGEHHYQCRRGHFFYSDLPKDVAFCQECQGRVFREVTK